MPAHEPDRQHPGDEAAIEQIDRKGARGDVGAARARVGAERFGPADVAAGTQRVLHAVGEHRRIAQPQVETLRADRRYHVCRLADERHPVTPGDVRGQPGQGKDGAGSHLLDRSEQALQAQLERARKAASSRWARCLAIAGRSTQTRLEERPGAGTTVSGPAGR